MIYLIKNTFYTTGCTSRQLGVSDHKCHRRRRYRFARNIFGSHRKGQRLATSQLVCFVFCLLKTIKVYNFNKFRLIVIIYTVYTVYYSIFITINSMFFSQIFAGKVYFVQRVPFDVTSYSPFKTERKVTFDPWFRGTVMKIDCHLPEPERETIEWTPAPYKVESLCQGIH